MRLFVTGATGFIGSHFVASAMAAGHEVIAHRRSETSRPRVALPKEPHWVTGPLVEVGERELAGVDVLVHLAAVGISPRVATWAELVEGNIATPVKLLLAAANAGVTRWIVTGSFAEYGNAGLRYDFIPPDAPLEPTYPYAASKAAGSVMFSTLATEKRARLSYLRLFSVFGEGQHEANLWPMIRQAALAGDDLPLTAGEQIRDFVAVEYVAAELLAEVGDESVDPGVPRVRNVGSGRPETVRAFAEHWWREFGARGQLQIGALPYRDGEVMRFVPLLESAANESAIVRGAAA
jgi:UDP-glucose 4-epimerase